MKPLSDITLRWFDDWTILEAEGMELIELFLAALGISSDVAVDIMEVLFSARRQDRSLTSEEIRAAIVKKREKEGRDNEGGLTLRNIQVWLRYFKEIKLVDGVGDRYRFSGNKKPSAAFRENVRPVAEQTMDYVERVLEKIEEGHNRE